MLYLIYTIINQTNKISGVVSMLHTKDTIREVNTGKVSIIIYPDDAAYRYNKYHELVAREYVSTEEYAAYQAEKY